MGTFIWPCERRRWAARPDGFHSHSVVEIGLVSFGSFWQNDLCPSNEGHTPAGRRHNLRLSEMGRGENWGADYFGCISPNWCVARCSRCGVFGRGGGESHGGGGRWVHSGGCFGDAGER